jgi:Bardet-Biedl syndrome 1 protein
VIGKVDVGLAVETLASFRDSGIMLTPRSMDLIGLDDNERRAMFIADYKDAPITGQTTMITCMDQMKKDTDGVDAISILIVGTESGHVHFLPPDPADSNIICTVKLSSAPVLLSTSGLFDIEWRVVVACRDGRVYNIKNGEVRGSAMLGSTIEVGSLAIAIARQDKNIVISSMDKQLASYSVRGKRASGIVLTDCVMEICVLQSRRSSSVTCLLVAMQSGEIRLYKGSTLIHSFTGQSYLDSTLVSYKFTYAIFVVEKPVMAMRFGPYGREDSSLIIIHGMTGAMTVKILKRIFDFDNVNHRIGAIAEQEIPLQVCTYIYPHMYSISEKNMNESTLYISRYLRRRNCMWSRLNVNGNRQH